VIAFRPYRDADLDAVARVWRESFLSSGVTPATPPTDAANRDRILRELAAHWRITVAIEDGAVVGFMATQPALGVLDQLFIAPSAQGKGLGAEMLRLAQDEMPGGFWLRAAQENVHACRFYEREGLRLDRLAPHPVYGHPTVVYVWP